MQNRIFFPLGFQVEYKPFKQILSALEIGLKNGKQQTFPETAGTTEKIRDMK
jgi:hypothetical protein